MNFCLLDLSRPLYLKISLHGQLGAWGRFNRFKSNLSGSITYYCPCFGAGYLIIISPKQSHKLLIVWGGGLSQLINKLFDQLKKQIVATTQPDD